METMDNIIQQLTIYIYLSIYIYLYIYKYLNIYIYNNIYIYVYITTVINHKHHPNCTSQQTCSPDPRHRGGGCEAAVRLASGAWIS